MPVILALDRLRQEDGEFQTSLNYIARSCLKKKTKKVPVLEGLFCYLLQKISGLSNARDHLFYEGIPHNPLKAELYPPKDLSNANLLGNGVTIM
jgi:hypothetical protein